MGVIYVARCVENQKVYIGQTKDLARRMREHKSHAKKDGGLFHEDILKYGFNSFIFEVIETCPDKEMSERETYHIAKAREMYGPSMVYNICDGGYGGQTHDTSGVHNPQFGIHKSEEEKRMLSEKLKGRPKPEGFGEKVSIALKGRKKSKEQVLKKSMPISVVNIQTGEIIHFDSRAEMARTLHCDISTVLKGRVTRSGFVLVKS